ncbi:MAG: DUF6107 family protein [Pseudomonadota bacterium]
MNESALATLYMLAAKLGGAIVGSAISIAYVFPHGRREAAMRFFTGVAGGMVFGTTVGVTLAKDLGIQKVLTDGEVALMGSAVASLAIWWVMGFLLRLANYPLDPPPRTKSKTNDEVEPETNEAQL